MQVEVKLIRDREDDKLFINDKLIRSKKNKSVDIYLRPKQEVELIKLAMKSVGIDVRAKLVDINNRIENVL